MRAISTVVRFKGIVKSTSGFTLLELLVVLSILGVMVGLVAPNLSSLLAKDLAHREAIALRNALQQMIDESWLEKQNRFIELSPLDGQQAQLIPWLRQKEQWQPQASIYTLNAQLNYSLNTSTATLDKAKQSLAMSQPSHWVVFSNGEYLPFRMQIEGAKSTYTLIGDGINGIQIQP